MTSLRIQEFHRLNKIRCIQYLTPFSASVFGSFSSFSSRPNFELLKILTILDDRSPGNWPIDKVLRINVKFCFFSWKLHNSILYLECTPPVLDLWVYQRQKRIKKQPRELCSSTYFISHSISRWFSNSSFLANNCCCKFWTKGSCRVPNGKLTNSIKL